VVVTKPKKARATTKAPQSAPGVDVSALYRPDDSDGQLYEAVANYMWPAFIASAWASAEIRKAFTEATGVKLDQPRSPMEMLVDKATGYRDTSVAKFIEWTTVELYGIEYAPKAVREAIAAGTFGKRGRRSA
jgi:hypothetical protein